MGIRRRSPSPEPLLPERLAGRPLHEREIVWLARDVDILLLEHGDAAGARPNHAQP